MNGVIENMYSFMHILWHKTQNPTYSSSRNNLFFYCTLCNTLEASCSILMRKDFNFQHAQPKTHVHMLQTFYEQLKVVYLVGSPLSNLWDAALPLCDHGSLQTPLTIFAISQPSYPHAGMDQHVIHARPPAQHKDPNQIQPPQPRTQPTRRAPNLLFLHT